MYSYLMEDMLLQSNFNGSNIAMCIAMECDIIYVSLFICPWLIALMDKNS